MLWDQGEEEGTFSPLTLTSSTSHLIPSIPLCQNYRFELRSKNRCTFGPYTETSFFAPSAPKAIPSLKPSLSHDLCTVTVTWEAPDDCGGEVTGYVVGVEGKDGRVY